MSVRDHAEKIAILQTDMFNYSKTYNEYVIPDVLIVYNTSEHFLNII